MNKKSQNSILETIKLKLQQSIPSSGNNNAIFFKTGEGQYSAHDQFIGVSTPNLRKIAKEFEKLTLSDIQTLLESSINEERLLALFILIKQYEKAESKEKEILYAFYVKNLKQVNNWNLVDSSAHLILGAHLFKKNKDLLLTLVRSESLWDRRIAIVATWYFIRQNDLEWTFKIATLLLNDPEDLIHKASGWMLREAGKKEVKQLIEFLEKHAVNMPRTMLRYAIEKFPETERKAYLRKKRE